MKGSRRREDPGSPKFTPEEAEAAREIMDRAIRRLNALEYVILLFALVMALVGGALVAWVLGMALGFPFRWSWAGASLLLFIVPGGFAYLRERRSRGDSPLKAGNQGDRLQNSTKKDPHG
jgi:hypothetical protein